MESRASMDIWLRRIPVPTTVRDPERIAIPEDDERSHYRCRSFCELDDSLHERESSVKVAITTSMMGLAIKPRLKNRRPLDRRKETVDRAQRRFGRLLRENRFANFSRISALKNRLILLGKPGGRHRRFRVPPKRPRFFRTRVHLHQIIDQRRCHDEDPPYGSPSAA